MSKLKKYVELFNKNDNELYKNTIPNDDALDWLSEEIPVFECPDSYLEEIYYFRWWTFRKHIKQTPDGYVITEFLPKVPWSSKYNVINAANGHHLMEGRWLKNSKEYLGDYIRFFLSNPEGSHQYSSWFIYAIWELAKVKGKDVVTKDLVLSLCSYYEEWERTHLLPNGMFWSIDNYDAMEMSISGTTKDGIVRKGIRPTLNSYMCADSLALSEMAKLVEMDDISQKYLQKHLDLKEKITEKLWDGEFFKAFHYDDEKYEEAFNQNSKDIAVEEIGYIPWYFNIPPKEYNIAFKLLADKDVFYTPYGITSASQREERFLYECDHECLWNGYVWPYATSQTLTALLNVCQNEKDNEEYKNLFILLLTDYAKSHYIKSEDGKTLPWIDEVKHPLYDDWSSRTILKNWNWREDKGGVERGKDYNHSTFCDLVISGIAGVNVSDEGVSINPIIPENWDYMCLTNLNISGDTYDIYYDKSGTHYNKGKGLTVYKNNMS